jgi:hypothetical protein
LLFREFLAKGYDPVPVNPQATEIEGRKCFPGILEVSPPVEAALLMTSAPETTDQAVRDCNQAGIRRIWIYKTVHDGDNHEQAMELCRSRGAAVVEGFCPCMFLAHPGLIHRFHGWFMKVAGTYPL